MDEVGEPDLKPVVFRDGHGGLEDGEAPRGDEAIVDGTIGAVEAVSEVEEEAGEGTNKEEEVDHEGVNVGALAVLVYGGEDHLKSEEGSCGEEVSEEGGFW